MKEIDQIILKMTNKNKNETKEKTGKLNTVKNVTFQAHALIISSFFYTNNYFVGFSKLLNHLLSYNL